MTEQDSTEPTTGNVSRRRLLGVAGAGALAGGAAIAGWQVGHGDYEEPQPTTSLAYDFHGEHQAGIVTPSQDRLHFASFDVTTDSSDDLIALLKAWTEAAAAMTAGKTVGAGQVANYDSPPLDTGEALGLPASGLTLTFGFGPTLFEKDGKDRFGLNKRRPKALKRLPHFPADNLDPNRTDGDLCVQACANDPQVAVHAIRNLARIGFGTVAVRWNQLGFGRTSSTSTTQATPRNLMGFKDGTANLKAEDSAEIEKFVWVDPADDAGADWLAGGSYLVARRIKIHIEPWDRTSLNEQENLIGRDRAHGAPLSGGTEFTELDLKIKGTTGPLIPMDAHVRLAHPTQNNGTRLLRRGYNFTDGTDALGRLDAGLFFIAYVRDPDKHYIPMQNQLSSKDGLMEYLQHTGSGLWAVPPGVKKGEYVGQALFS
ncbi:iron uptake transporter deferrochelatase/peroxidase subunit [Nocardioides marmorisolisilvae]|uniref:Deferrochelatase n=1 Tax=Nocardioides marmorisolisilvae TaxID=1542737 RepID=A0A3N0DRM0_9ACTN|nr:iron uptake transporter deferrochelatase/peroxidase subunit [Nocardioides marmorisolisilvae]RNL78272.1 deferrochelatase/peroxidase EfeB [Nocardioides marmorisolisilvae]